MLTDLPAVPAPDGAHTPLVVYCDRTVSWVLRSVHRPYGVDRIRVHLYIGLVSEREGVGSDIRLGRIALQGGLRTRTRPQSRRAKLPSP